MKRWRRAIDTSIMAWVLILGPAVFVTSIGPWLDSKFPVANPFVVLQYKHDNGLLVLSGMMNKQRERCKPIELFAIVRVPGSLPSVVDISFLERKVDRLVSRPAGEQTWGPWLIPVPADATEVTLHTLHSCHGLWDTPGNYLLWKAKE